MTVSIPLCCVYCVLKSLSMTYFPDGVDQNLMILLCAHNSISFNKIARTTDLNVAPNHGRASLTFFIFSTKEMETNCVL